MNISPEDQTQEEILQDILYSIADIIKEARDNRMVLHEVEEELEETYAAKKMTEFTYQIYRERLRRASQDINFCLRSLDRQRKIAIQKLQELE